MITLEAAKAKIKVVFPDAGIASILEVQSAWVFALARDGQEVDAAPVSVEKQSGKMEAFFPPDHIDELEKAVEIL